MSGTVKCRGKPENHSNVSLSFSENETGELDILLRRLRQPTLVIAKERLLRRRMLRRRLLRRRLLRRRLLRRRMSSWSSCVEVAVLK